MLETNDGRPGNAPAGPVLRRVSCYLTIVVESWIIVRDRKEWGVMRNGFAGAIATIAGFLVVLIGILALVALALVGMNALPTANKAQNVISLVTSTGGVIGTIVGAYFGVKLGTAGSQEVTQRALEMAAVADPERAQQQLAAPAQRERPAASA